MTQKPQFSISIGCDDIVKKVTFAEKHGFGVEIGAFYAGPALFDAAARKEMEGVFGAALRGFPGRRSLHGAFIDLAIHSADPAIAAVTRDRIVRDLEMASRLGCRTVVFHTGFNPLVPGAQYGEEFVERQAAFWPALADQFPETKICLENMWETSPEILERLFRRLSHPRVRLCFDVAHAYAFSRVAVETWLHRVSSWIAHMHWNDNRGDTDSHLPIGKGTLAWEKVRSFARQLPDDVTVVLELSTLRAIQQSLKYLTELDSANDQAL